MLSQDEKVKFFKKIDASGDDQVDYKVLLGRMLVRGDFQGGSFCVHIAPSRSLK